MNGTSLLPPRHFLRNGSRSLVCFGWHHEASTSNTLLCRDSENTQEMMRSLASLAEAFRSATVLRCGPRRA